MNCKYLVFMFMCERMLVCMSTLSLSLPLSLCVCVCLFARKIFRSKNLKQWCNVILISDYFQNNTKCLIIYHVISCQICGLVCKGKYNNITDNLLTDCCHIYTHDNLSVYWFYEHKRKMC